MSARVRSIGLMVVAVVVVGMVTVACGDDDDATEEESVATTVAEEAAPGSTAPQPTATTSTSIAATPSTTTPSVATGGASPWPWHAPGSAHTDPADAVTEFAEFVGFAEGFTLGDFLEGDARSGEIEIVALAASGLPIRQGSEPVGPPETLADDPDLLPWSPTTAFVRLDADDHWTVIGAASDAIVVNQPTPEATVSSPLDVALTHKLGNTDGVWMEIWPDGSGEVLLEEDLHPASSGIFTQGDGEWSIQVPPGAPGPATIIFESRDPGGTVAVTTVRIELTS